MNLSTYIARYLPILHKACDALPESTTFPSGTWSPYTHVVRLRQTRKYLVSHPAALPSLLRTPDYIDRLNTLNFWSVDDTIHLGIRANYSHETDPLLTTSPPPTSAWNIITKPLTEHELQALFYCYNNELLSFPTRIENPSPDIISLVERFSAQCPHAGVAYHDNSISLL